MGSTKVIINKHTVTETHNIHKRHSVIALKATVQNTDVRESRRAALLCFLLAAIKLIAGDMTLASMQSKARNQKQETFIYNRTFRILLCNLRRLERIYRGIFPHRCTRFRTKIAQYSCKHTHMLLYLV